VRNLGRNTHPKGMWIHIPLGVGVSVVGSKRLLIIFEYVFSKGIANGCRVIYTDITKERKVGALYG